MDLTMSLPVLTNHLILVKLLRQSADQTTMIAAVGYCLALSHSLLQVPTNAQTVIFNLFQNNGKDHSLKLHVSTKLVSKS